LRRTSQTNGSVIWLRNSHQYYVQSKLENDLLEVVAVPFDIVIALKNVHESASRAVIHVGSYLIHFVVCRSLVVGGSFRYGPEPVLQQHVRISRSSSSRYARRTVLTCSLSFVVMRFSTNRFMF
jgi:hypothetical protein